MNIAGTRNIAGRRAPYRGRLNGGCVGATLAEVLIALLILGIGLVSVATLFPLSLLRSVRATQLTNAAILRQNAETFLAGQVTPMEQGEGGSPFAVLADPDGADSDSADTDADAFTGPNADNEPYDDGLQAFVLDPLGAVDLGGATFRVPDATDSDADGDTTELAPFGGVHGRFTANLANLVAARAAATLGDGTTEVGQTSAFTVFNTAPSAGAYVVVNVTDDGIDEILDGMTPGLSRITVESDNGTRSATRLVYAIIPDADERRIYVTEDLDGDGSIGTPTIGGTTYTEDDAASGTGNGNAVLDGVVLPANLRTNVGRLIVENPEDRYSWIATVRRDSDPTITRPTTAAIYLATFFRRSFGGLATDEQPYRFIEGGDPTQPFFVAWPDGVTPPRIKKGAWFCNLEDLRWYLVTDVLAQFRDNAVPSEFQLYSGNDLTGDGDDNDFGPADNENVIAFSISPEFYVPITGRTTGEGAGTEGAANPLLVSGTNLSATGFADRYDPADTFDPGVASPHEYPRAIFPRGVITVFPFTISSIP